ncbi:MAG: IS21 family transposase [bacterium]
MKYRQNQPTLIQAAAQAGMDVKTARKYWKAGRLPSRMKVEHTWPTREDPFAEVGEEVKLMLENNAGLEAKTLFEDLQRKYPGRFADGQLRTFQRRVKVWRALAGPGKEVFFPQEHHPGVLCQSDFTQVSKLGITIDGQPFPHRLYHFVLTYSNWETGTICFSENFESLSEGLQNALWELGGVPQAHQTDRLTPAVQIVGEKEDPDEEFTSRYRSVLRHYGLEGRAIQAGRAHENGDVEQRHHRLKRALEQALWLRGHRDFRSREDYEGFLRRWFQQLNAGRRERFQEEVKRLRPLPARRLEDGQRMQVKVGPSSTIHVLRNTYSVGSRLIGERVEARIDARPVEIWYAQRCLEKLPRLRGERKHRIDYRHIIGWLVRKPGAFAHYRYRAELFPSSPFRMAYDVLPERLPAQADREYWRILYLAAQEGESRVEEILRSRLNREERIDAKSIQAQLEEKEGGVPAPPRVEIGPVDLRVYDRLREEEVSPWVP